LIADAGEAAVKDGAPPGAHQRVEPRRALGAELDLDRSLGLPSGAELDEIGAVNAAIRQRR
jgi:hypothetical protein